MKCRQHGIEDCADCKAAAEALARQLAEQIEEAERRRKDGK